MQLDDLDRLDCLNSLLEDYPNFSDLHYLKAQRLISDQSDEAIIIFKQITERINPAHSFAWYRLGCLLLNEDQLTAVNALSRSLSLRLYGIEAHHADGLIHWFEGGYDIAVQALGDVIVIDQQPTWQEVREQLAALYLYLERYQKVKGILGDAEQTPRSDYLLENG